jgi:protein phosphatase PTC2/3
MEEALKETFKRVDAEFLAIAEETRNYSGSTAVVTCIHNGVLYCANSGDSRAILCRNHGLVSLR